MAKRSSARNAMLLAAWIVGSWAVVPPEAAAQDVRPLAPILEPAEPVDRPDPEDDEREGEPADPELIPLPRAASRAAAASGDRVRVAAVLPASWSDVVAGYQPYWTGIASAGGFGLQRWTAYFAAAGLVAVPTPHPFLGPWGMLAYEGRLFERYRSVWGPTGIDGLRGEAAEWLQRGDHAMAFGRPAEAAHAYRRVTHSAPDFPLGYFGLGVALAELGEDEAAARAFRQALDHYPAWLALTMDWTLLFPDDDRLARVQAAAAERASDPSSRLVAGVLHLFGDRPGAGQGFLRALVGDPHAELLLARSPQ